MSPSIPQLRTAERAQMNERRFLDQLGPAASVADAREASVEDVLAAQIGDARLAASMQSFTPTHDTEVFPNDIVAAAANDTRPLVIGTTRDEMQLFAAFDPARSEWTEDHLSSEFQRRFGERADEAIAIYRRLDPEGTVSQLVSAMQTDEVFRQPSIALAEARVSQSNPTWMYLFDQTSSAFGGRMASCHGLDLPFAFDTLSARGAKMFTGSHDGLSTVAEQFSGALIAFARQCEPGWPAYSLEGRQTQRIGPHPQVVDDPEADRRKLWSTGESPS
jgi:para-nitrobenzyl esterase